ncbi:ubiquitin carboxyl-terminal hydrolase 44-like [Styela clava]
MKNNASSVRMPSPRQNADKSSPKRGSKSDNQNLKLQGGCKGAKPCTKGGDTIVKQEENYLARCTNFRLTTGYELSICNCKHIRKIRIGERHSIVNPQRWLCETCFTTESVWACLSCPNVACGRFIKEHALTHFQESGHPLVIDVNELYVFCYKCDDYVLNDNNSSDIKVLRETLLAIRYQNFTGTTRSGHTLRSAMITEQVDVEMRRQMQQEQLDRDDRLFTAIWHSRFVRQRKAFRRWVRYIHWKRTKTVFPLESSDDDTETESSDIVMEPPDLTESCQSEPLISLPTKESDIKVLSSSHHIDSDDENNLLLPEISVNSESDTKSDTTDTDVSDFPNIKSDLPLIEEDIQMDVSLSNMTELSEITEISLTNSDVISYLPQTFSSNQSTSQVMKLPSVDNNEEFAMSDASSCHLSSNESLPGVNETADVIVDVMLTDDVIKDDVTKEEENSDVTEVPVIPLNILSRPKRSNAAARYKEIFGSLNRTSTVKRERNIPSQPKFGEEGSPEQRKMSLRPRPSGRRSDRIKKINKKKERASTTSKKKVVQRKPQQSVKLIKQRHPPPKRKRIVPKKTKPRPTKNSIRSIQDKQKKRKKQQAAAQTSHRTRRLISASGSRQERKRLDSYRPPSLYDNIPNKAVTSLIPGVTGLRNLGNTCYLNSIIQVLGHLQKFRLCLLALRELEFREAFSLVSKEISTKNISDNFVFSTPQAKPARTMNRRTTVELYNEQNKPTPLSVRNSDRARSGLNGGQSSNSITEPLPPVSPPSPSRINCRSPSSVTGSEPWSSSLSLCNELDHLYQVMWSGKWKLVSPYHFLHSVWSLIPSFRGYTQQDAQEFLCELLDKIVSELERCRNTENKSVLRILEVVQKVFEGQLKSRVRCLECGHVSSTVEPFWDLSLEFPERYHKINSTKRRPSTNSKAPPVPVDTCTLHEMLQNFTAPETLEGGRVYGCSKCNFFQQPPIINPDVAGSTQKKRPPFRKNSQKLTEAEKQLKVLELPQVLRFHLKRFRWIGRNHREKIAVHVDFPPELDMRPYCWNNGNDCNNEVQYMYDLSAVVMHHGRGFGSGHYTANCWNDIGEFWVHCNDSNLELRSIEDVMMSQAYILFYTQRGLDPQPHILSPPQTPKVSSPTHTTPPPS